ncbi:MAG: hypothetical protein K2Q33_05915 [Gammaproteobacteria bacterium]|nr:hypothetical protein [Gammaproteobacteria bacterium]
MYKSVKRLLAVAVLSVFCLAQVGFACEMMPTPLAPTASWANPPQGDFTTYYQDGHFYHDCGNGKCYMVEPKTVGEVSSYHYYYGR